MQIVKKTNKTEYSNEEEINLLGGVDQKYLMKNVQYSSSSSSSLGKAFFFLADRRTLLQNENIFWNMLDIFKN